MNLIFSCLLSPFLCSSSCYLSLCIFITPCTSPIRPPPLDNLSLYLLSGLFTEVSVQPSSSSPPLFLSLSNPLLSFPLSRLLIPTHWDWINQLSSPLLHSNLVSFHLEPPPHLFPSTSPVFLTPSASVLTPPYPLSSPFVFFLYPPPPKRGKTFKSCSEVKEHRASICFLVSFFLPSCSSKEDVSVVFLTEMNEGRRCVCVKGLIDPGCDCQGLANLFSLCAFRARRSLVFPLSRICGGEY